MNHDDALRDAISTYFGGQMVMGFSVVAELVDPEDGDELLAFGTATRQKTWKTLGHLEYMSTIVRGRVMADDLDDDED